MDLNIRYILRASTPVLSMWPQSIKSIVKESKCPGLAYEIGFSVPNSCSLPWLVSPQHSCAPPKRNEWLRLNISDWSRWFAISSYHVYAISVTILLVGLPKKKKAILRHLILLSRVTYLALVEMLFLHTGQNKILYPPQAQTSIKNPIPVLAWY